MKQNCLFHFTIMILFILIATTQTIAQYSRNTTLVGRRAEGPSYAVAVSGSLACFGNGSYLEIVDFTDPSVPQELARVLTPSLWQL